MGAIAEAPRTVLIVDDDPLIRWTLKEHCESAGHRVVEAATGAEGLARFSEGVDATLLDWMLPDMDGRLVLQRVMEIDPDAAVIVLTAFSSIEGSVEIMKAGAFHYAAKPFGADVIMRILRDALEATQLRRAAKTLASGRSEPDASISIVGESPAIRETKALLEKVARSGVSTVLLTGESGVGKDLAARVLHGLSARRAQPFVNITCSALSETLLENELFGHERGAFTDARQQKRGLLEEADGGSVFLDEVSEMAPGLQAKVLRFLEQKTFKRVGGNTDIHVDVRVIAATNRRLEEQIQNGSFREDLYYRICVMPIAIPALRERDGDIRLLVAWYVERFNREFKKQVREVTEDALELLESYPWPGNVRELKNSVERAVLLSEGPTLSRASFLPLGARRPQSGEFLLPRTGISLEQLERDVVRQALELTGGNRTKAARLLGMNRDQIRYRIEKFQLEAFAKPGR
jgi:two-component system, NtrC family, response regulator AtoC